MKILVIGASGFIGSNAVLYFKEKGYEVWTVSMRDTFSNIDDIFKYQQYDVCINASGSANVGLSFETPQKDFEANVQHLHHILFAIHQYNPLCKVINFSSAAVYGNPKDIPITENSLVHPISPYGLHKLHSEYLMTSCHKYMGLRTCNLRIFSGYGIGLKKQLFWDLYQKSRQFSTIKLFGTGEETRDFIFINDLLQAVELVIEKANFEGEAINIASGIETKIKDAVSIFLDLLNTNNTFCFTGENKTGDPQYWHACINTIQTMGFKTQYTLEQGLQKYIAWLKEIQ